MAEPDSADDSRSEPGPPPARWNPAERGTDAGSAPRPSRAPTLEEYRTELVRCGGTALPGAPGTFWVKYESLALMRVPTFVTTPPSRAEIRRLFVRSHMPVLAHISAAENGRPANAWLYLARRRAYALDALPPTMRRNVRRGLAELDIRWTDRDELLAHGCQAFCDTRARNGLQDGSRAEFERRFGQWSRCPGHVFLGAWRDGTLVGFLSVVDVDDWAEVEGCFSRDDGLGLRPNDTLLYAALRTYLVERGHSHVSYGLSSIQPGGAAGLHAFKTKVGFEAVPVHRAFELHPLLRPMAGPVVSKGLNALLRLRPRDRRLRKAAGVLSTVLGRAEEWSPG